MVILHHRVGGPATAAVLANAIPGLAGFGCSVLLTLHLTAVSLGIVTALFLGLGVSVVWNAVSICDTAPPSPHLSISLAPNRD